MIAVSVAGFTRSEVLFNQTFAVRDGGTLAVDLSAASVTVETTAGREATVTVEGTGRDARREFERLRFSAAVSGNRLDVRTRPQGRQPRGTQASFAVTLRIPQRFDATIDTGSGSVRVGTLDGALSVDTGSGSVRTEDVRGAVTVDTGSGSVQLGRIAGRLAVDTGSGSVSVAEQSGPARLETGSGSVSVTLARADALTVDTGSGSVRVSVARGTDADVSASGSSVRIDEALGFQGRRDRREVEGQIGRGGSRLSIDTGSGGITISER